MSNKKILIFGLDGCTWTILHPAIQAGYMPNLKCLIENGTSGILKSTVPAITPAAWGTFQTGVNPEKNKVFDFAYWNKKDKSLSYVNSCPLQKTVWEIASENSLNVSTINVPMTYPPRKINGYVISGILTPSLNANFTYPPEFKTELLKHFPDYNIFTTKNISTFFKDYNFKSLVDEITNIIIMRAEVAKFVLSRQKNDIFMLHFQATDVIQHLLWPYLDSKHKMFDSQKQDYIFSKFYNTLDSLIIEIIDQFKLTGSHTDENIIVLASDHGFEAHEKRFNLGNWLIQEGFLIRETPSEPPLLKRITKKLRVGSFLGKLLTNKTIKLLEKMAGISHTRFNWQSSRAYSIGKSGEGFIYLLNTQAKDYQDSLGRLMSQLENLIDTQNNAKIIKQIYTKEELFGSKAPDIFPDIILIPTEGYSFTGYVNNENQLIHKITSSEDFHLGKHNPDGIFVVSGNGIKTNQKINLRIHDIVPSLLYYLNIPIPSYMDGKVAKELFDTKNEIDYDKTAKQHDNKVIITPHDNDEIEKRLKNLGYM